MLLLHICGYARLWVLHMRHVFVFSVLVLTFLCF